MDRTSKIAGSCLLVTAVATGCATPTPSADDVLVAAQDVRGSSEFPAVVEPQPGRGTADLPDFTPDGPYRVTISCLGSASVGLTIDEEVVPAEDCSDGMRGVGREASGGDVSVFINAPDDVYWVAGVIQCKAVENGTNC